MATDEDAPHEETDDRLPDEAVVIRGGLSTPDTLHMTSLTHHDWFGDFAISARSLPGLSADDLALVEPRLPQPKLRETTVLALRAGGYDVIRDEPPPAHALIMLGRLPADDDYVRIAAIFGEPRQNPGYRKEQD